MGASGWPWKRRDAVVEGLGAPDDWTALKGQAEATSFKNPAEALCWSQRTVGRCGGFAVKDVGAGGPSVCVDKDEVEEPRCVL